MKKVVSILLLICLVFPCIAFAGDDDKNAKDETGVYVWCVSMAFPESVVYFTEVQYVDGVELEKGFLQ